MDFGARKIRAPITSSGARMGLFLLFIWSFFAGGWGEGDKLVYDLGENKNKNKNNSGRWCVNNNEIL